MRSFGGPSACPAQRAGFALLAVLFSASGCSDDRQSDAAAAGMGGDTTAVSAAGAAVGGTSAGRAGAAGLESGAAADAGELSGAGGAPTEDSDAGSSAQAQAGMAGQPSVSGAGGVSGAPPVASGSGGTLNQSGAGGDSARAGSADPNSGGTAAIGGSATSGSGGTVANGGSTEPNGGLGETGGASLNCAGAGAVPCAAGFTCVSNHCQVTACDGALGLPALPFRPPGLSLNAAASADFNGDGLLDVAVIDSNLLSILINQGEGQLALTVSLELGGQDLVAADLNGDARPDLAVATDQGLSVLLNQGALHFAAPSVYPAAVVAWSLATADLDGDAALDVVIADSADDKLSVLRNRGDGTFLAPEQYVTGSHPNAVVLNDLNGDGRLDAVTSNYFGNSLSVFFNQGQAGFAAAVTLATDAMPTFLAAGDLTGDGRSELVVSHQDDHVTILANQGNGAFLPAWSEAVGMTPYGVTVADLDGDADLDIATANYNGGVTILANAGGGSFIPSQVSVGRNPEAVIAADLNLDGRRDLIVTNQGDNDITVLSSDGTKRGYGLAPTQYYAGGGLIALAAADFNRDGSLDLAATSAPFNDQKLQILLNRGDATFDPQIGPAITRGATAIAAGDLDGDRFPDLAVADRQTNGVNWFRNRGDATFDAPKLLTTGLTANQLALGDVDADGDLDIAVANMEAAVSVLANLGGGVFSVGTLWDTGHVPASMRITDVDDDGHLDLLTTDSRTARLFWGNGKGQFTQPDAIGLWSDASVAEAADFDGDGHSDLVLTGANADRTLLLRGQGGRQFKHAEVLPSVQIANSLAALDVNLDGQLDLVSADGTQVDVFLNDGHGQLQTPLSYNYSSNVSSLVTGQFDSDGRPDVVVSASAGVSIMRNVCLPAVAAPDLPSTPPPPPMPDFANLKRTCDQRALPFGLVDAEYSRSLDRIVIAATQPNQLVILEPRAGTSSNVPLALPPSAVSVAPAGHTAVVLQQGTISWIDLDSASVIKSFSGWAGGDIVLADNQFAYLFSDVDGLVASIDLVHETSTVGSAFASSGITLNATKNVIYACSPLFGPISTQEYGIAAGHAQYQATSDTPWAQYPPLFASLDGNRTFNSTGTVLYAAPFRSRDMKVETALQGPFSNFGYRYIADDLVNRRTYAIQGGNTYLNGLLGTFVEPEQWIGVYAELDLAYQGKIPVPCRREANQEWDGYGRFVFASAAGDRIYVITTTNNDAALTHRWGLGVFDALGRPVPAASQ